jgi:tetratricopeptide (TPR) repeat protein
VGDLLEKARRAVKAKQLDRAAELLEELLAAEPDNLPAIDLAGFVEFFRGNPRLAETFCRRALEVRPDHAYALSGLGSCLSKQGRIDEAIAHFERAIEVRPDWFEPWFDLAVALDRDGRHAPALELLERARERFPAKTKRIDGLAARIKAGGGK